MAAEIVNLRMARKRVARAKKEADAARNRFEHGRSKAERDLASARNRQAESKLEAGRLTGDAPDEA